MNKFVLTEPLTLYFQGCEIIQLVLFCWMTMFLLCVISKTLLLFFGKGDVSRVYRYDFRFPLKLGFLTLLVGINKTFYLIQYGVPPILIESDIKYEFRVLVVLLDALFPMRMGILILLVGYVETLFLEYVIKKGKNRRGIGGKGV